MSLTENTGGEQERISFTLFTKDKGILTKHMRLIDGQLEKDASECRMSRGRAETITLAPAQFGAYLQGLKPNQAIAHGICEHSKALIVSKAKETGARAVNGLPVIARSKEHFRYPKGPGVLMLDHDKARDNAVSLDAKALTAYTPDRLAEIISSFFPEIKQAAYVAACSTSSCIYNTETNEELRGKGAGFHLYLFPRNAVDAPRFLKVLGKRLFLAGYGRIEISRAGSLLERTLADLLVGSPERLDFVAGAVCGQGIKQRRPEPEQHQGSLLDTAKLPDLSTEEEAAYQEIIRQLKEKAQPTQEAVKVAYIEQEAEKLASSSGGTISLEQAKETVKTRQNHVLADDDLLHFAHLKEAVSVAHALEHGPEFNGKACADPLEPEYNGGSRSTAKFYWNNGKPIVRSHAHGVIKYMFRRFSAKEPVDFEAADDDTLRQGMDWKTPLPVKDELPPVEPMRAEMMPEPFRAWVTEAADRMQVPADFLIVPLVVVCASVIGTSCRIRPKQQDDWSVVPNLWGGIVGPPSMMKTPALNEAVNKTLGRLEAAAGKAYQEALAEYEVKAMIADAEQSKLKEEIKKTVKAGQDTGRSTAELAGELRRSRPERPAERRYKTNDSSIEKIVELLRDNPRGLLYFRDELIALFKRMERAGNEQDRAFMLEAWNGDGCHVDDRIGRGTVRADNICLSLLGGIQPDKIAEYLHRAVASGDNDGFVQRLQLMVYPDPAKDWQYIDRKPDSAARNRACKVIQALAELEVMPPENQQEKPFLRFSRDGQAVFQEWLTRLQREKLTDERDHSIILEHLAKYRSLMPSLALVFHLIECADQGRSPDPVSREAAEKAAAWCQYLESHARRIYSLALNTGRLGGEALAKKIRSGALPDGFKLRDVQMKKWGLLTSGEAVQDALDWLVEKHWLREMEPDRGTAQGGRPPACSYAINPKIFAE